MANTVGSITAQLSETFNLAKSAGWDPVGLQFGDPGRVVSSVAVCHEVTPQVTDQLVSRPVDLVVSYHLLLFRPTTRLIIGNGPAGRAFRLIAAGISLLVVHTGFDAAPGGTADTLAASLGLTGTSGIAPMWAEDSSKIITFVPNDWSEPVVAAMTAAGAGRIGNYSSCSYRSEGVGSFIPGDAASPLLGSAGEMQHEPEVRIEMIAPRAQVNAVVAALARSHPYEEPAFDVVETRSNAGFAGRVGELETAMTVEALASKVADKLGGVVRIAGTGAVSTVAVLPGSGGSMLSGVDADVVVTGDISHHQARELVARGVAVIDPGHAATERPGVQALYAAVAEIVGSAVDMTDVDSDPWKER